MDPISALVISWIATSWLTARGAADTAWSQARAEARIAAGAVRADLKTRREQWAKDLVDRLADGREGGPSKAAWWGWAGLRTAQAIRRAARREPRPAENVKAVRGTAGPWRRIWDAAVRGGRHAYGNRHRPGRPTRLGVCDRCGTVVARTSLQFDEEAQELVCVTCVTGRTEPAETTAEDARPPQQPTAPQRPQLDPPAPDAPASGRGNPSAPPAPEPDPAPAPAAPGLAPELDRIPVPAAQPVDEGGFMPARNPGQVVLRRPALPGSPRRARASGEVLTHGQFQRAVAAIEERMEELPAALEAMLQRLTAAEAGRSQVAGVLRTHKDVVAWMAEVRAMLAEVNRREQPVLNAVTAAGGPGEIANLDYYREV